MKKILGMVVLGLVLQSCAGGPVGWGGTHEVIQSNSASITFKYDTILGPNKIWEPASAHCKKFDKQAVPTVKSIQSLGIAIQTFECK
jgi:hypothetical protein